MKVAAEPSVIATAHAELSKRIPGWDQPGTRRAIQRRISRFMDEMERAIRERDPLLMMIHAELGFDPPDDGNVAELRDLFASDWRAVYIAWTVLKARDAGRRKRGTRSTPKMSRR